MEGFLPFRSTVCRGQLCEEKVGCIQVHNSLLLPLVKLNLTNKLTFKKSF